MIANQRNELIETTRTREIAYWIYCSIDEGKTTKVSRTQFWKLASDEQAPRGPLLTEAEKAEMFNRYGIQYGSKQAEA